MRTQGTIVVGVDGSDCSRTALEFALDEAVLRGAGVRVVAAAPEADWATSYGMSPSLLEDLAADLEKMTLEDTEPPDFIDPGEDVAFNPEVMDGECSA